MYLIPLARLSLVIEGYLHGALLSAHRGDDRQYPQTGNPFDVTLHLLGIEDLLTHHLVTAADADDRLSVMMRLKDSLCTTVAP